MTIGPGDALFGQDGTGDGIGGTEPVDDIGPLPGFDLSVRLPTVGLDGVIVGLDEFDADIAGSPAPGGREPTPRWTGWCRSWVPARTTRVDRTTRPGRPPGPR